MNIAPLTHQALSDIKKNILATLAYFDMFNYPLTLDEVYLYMPVKCDPEEFDSALRDLLIDRLIYKIDKFYTLKNDHFLIERRVNGNAKAASLIKIAKKVSNALIRFPYVKGIAISGSLSKNFADDDSDIDLFIITTKNRLWIARSLMHILKKLSFLVKKQHYFCMNYYIDEAELQIREKNIYTAIEVATLMPLHGDHVFEQFYNTNAWTRNYLPNKYLRLTTASSVKRSALKRFVELLFNNRIGNALDNLLMRVTAKRWLKKEQMKKRNNHGMVMGMDAAKHYAKPDPKNFQSKLILKYVTKVELLLERSENSLIH